MIPILLDEKFDIERLFTVDGRPVYTSDDLAVYVQKKDPKIPEDNGIGVLYETPQAYTISELNGCPELVFQYPEDGLFFKELALRRVVMATVNRTKKPQPFRIYRITTPIEGVSTVYAKHIAYDLSGIIAKPYKADNIQSALAGLKTNSMTINPFTFSTKRTTLTGFSPLVPADIWTMMGGGEGGLIDIYGGEYSFDGYNVSLENRVGGDYGASVRYGVNMTDFEQDKECNSCYTGVVAYWEHDGDVAYSQIVSAGGNYGYVRLFPLDVSDYFSEKPSETLLQAAARAYIQKNKIGIPKVSWRINFVPLDTTEEYKDIADIEAVDLGDTVSVEFAKIGVTAEARAQSIKWNVLDERYDEVILGSIQTTIAKVVVKQSKDIAGLPSRSTVVGIASQSAMDAIRSGTAGDVGSGFGNCKTAFDDESLLGYQESTGRPLFRIGTQLDNYGAENYIHGQLRLYALGPSWMKNEEYCLIGADTDNCGIILHDLNRDSKSRISAIIGNDLGAILDITDHDGKRLFGVQNGTVIAKKLKLEDESGNKNNVADYIIETGQDGIWYWRKFASGISECFGFESFDEALSTSKGSLYVGGEHRANFPSGLFKSSGNPKSCNISVDGNAMLLFSGGSTYEHTQKYYLAYPTSAASSTFYIFYHAVGTWK